MKTELELGRGIEELVQISITVNFAMENYYGRTNPLFFEAVMSYYEILEAALSSSPAGADDEFSALEGAAMGYSYREKLQESKKAAIDSYLEECQKIIEPIKPDFNCDAWFENRHCSDTAEEREAIIKLMGEIRKMEELYMEGANAMKTKQTVQDQKKRVFARLLTGQAPRESELGGYMSHKKDMQNTAYFPAPERLRSIFGISDGGED